MSGLVERLLLLLFSCVKGESFVQDNACVYTSVTRLRWMGKTNSLIVSSLHQFIISLYTDITILSVNMICEYKIETSKRNANKIYEHTVNNLVLISVVSSKMQKNSLKITNFSEVFNFGIFLTERCAFYFMFTISYQSSWFETKAIYVC